MSRPKHLHSAFYLTLGTATLIGCSATSNPPPSAPEPMAGSALQGKVHGGQQPVSNSIIQLYAAGSSGYSSSATPLLTTSVITDSNGVFTITGDYTCPSSTAQVYITATGGNPGLPGNVNNPAIALTAALGNCGSLSSSTTIIINELTTVAAAYSLAQFATGATNIGTSSTNLIGLSNAFAKASVLVNFSSGSAGGPNLQPLDTIPIPTLNTLANILATCINSNGFGTSCSSLFTLATPNAATAPTDTIQAALNIARAPGSNVAALFALAMSSPPFQPTLASAPPDWTIAVTHSGGGLFYNSSGQFQGSPYFSALDSSGNLYVGSIFGISSNTMTIISPTGAATSTGTPLVGFNQSPGVFSFDPSGYLWQSITTHANVQPTTYTSLSKITTGTSTPTTLVSGCGIFPLLPLGSPSANLAQYAIAGDGTVWLANATSVYKISSNCSTITPYSGGGITTAAPIAIDSAGNIWVANQSSLSELTSGGVALSPSTGFTGGGLNNPVNLAIDALNNVWAINKDGSVSKFLPSGTPASGSPFSFSSISTGRNIVVDGAGNIWAGNGTEFDASGTLLSPSQGYPINVLGIDSSGDVWSSATATATELVGLAAPTTSPLSSALANHKIGQRP